MVRLGCCWESCDPEIVRPSDSWDGWDTPPPDPDDDGTVASGHATSIEVPRASGTWTIDVEIIDWNNSYGTEISVGVAAVELFESFSSPYVRMLVGSCSHLYAADVNWIRFQEATIDGERVKRIELWEVKPGPLADPVYKLATRCMVSDPLSPTPDDVTITITAGDTDLQIGEVFVQDSQPTSTACPPIAACNPSTRYLVTHVQTVLTKWTDLSCTFDYSGPRNDGFGWFGPICNFGQQATLGWSAINGTYLWQLGDIFGNRFTATETQELLDLIRQRGLCQLDWDQYVWHVPRIDISSLLTYTNTPGNCNQVLPKPPQRFGQTPGSEGVGNWLDGTELWPVSGLGLLFDEQDGVSGAGVYYLSVDPGTLISVTLADNQYSSSGNSVYSILHESGNEIGESVPLIQQYAPADYDLRLSYDGSASNTNNSGMRGSFPYTESMSFGAFTNDRRTEYTYEPIKL